jgi:hypothetical protein
MAVLILMTLLISCTPKIRTKPMSMPIGKDLAKKSEARFLLPGGWRPMAPSLSRMEFLGPDRRSRIYIKAIQSSNKLNCARENKKTVREVIESWGARTKVMNQSVFADSAEFELRRKDPQPGGETLWYRVLCKDKIVIIAYCAIPTPREKRMKASCQTVLESMGVYLAEERN